MSLSTRNSIEIIARLDSMKKFYPSIDGKNLKKAALDNDFSMFVMFYILHNHFGNIYDIEIEAIDYIVDDEGQANRLKALSSVFKSDEVWINPYALYSAICTFNNIDFSPSEIDAELSAEQVLWGIINIGAIEGAMNLPFSPSCMNSIRYWLEEDGYTIPPSPMCFNNLLNYYDNKDSINSQREIMGGYSLVELSKGNIPEEVVSMGDRAINMYALSSKISSYISLKLKDLIQDWTESIKKSKA